MSWLLHLNFCCRHLVQQRLHLQFLATDSCSAAPRDTVQNTASALSVADFSIKALFRGAWMLCIKGTMFCRFCSDSCFWMFLSHADSTPWFCRNCHPPPTSSFSPFDALVPQEDLAQPPASVVTHTAVAARQSETMSCGWSITVRLLFA